MNYAKAHTWMSNGSTYSSSIFLIICTTASTTFYDFYRQASRDIDIAITSVRLSVRHTLVLCKSG